MIIPCGSTAASGLEFITVLRPPTRAVKNETTGEWASAYNPGSLGTEPMDPAAQGWTGGFLDEEAYQWVREVELLTDEECLLPYPVGLDLNTAFLAAAARLVVGAAFTIPGWPTPCLSGRRP